MPRIQFNPYRAHKRDDVKRLEASQKSWVSPANDKLAWARPNQDSNALEASSTGDPDLVFYNSQERHCEADPPAGTWRCCYEPAGGPATVTDAEITFEKVWHKHAFVGRISGHGEDANGRYEITGHYSARHGRFAWSEKHPHLREHHMECSAVGVLQCFNRFIVLRGSFRTNRGAQGTVTIAAVRLRDIFSFSFPEVSPSTGKAMKDHIFEPGSQFDFRLDRLPDLLSGHRCRQPDAFLIALSLPPPPILKRPSTVSKGPTPASEALQQLHSDALRSASLADAGNSGDESGSECSLDSPSAARRATAFFSASDPRGAASPRAMLWLRTHPNAPGCSPLDSSTGARKVFMPIHALQQRLKTRLLSGRKRKQVKLQKRVARSVFDPADLLVDYAQVWEEQVQSLVALNEGLPAGWECLRDPASGVPYYINHRAACSEEQLNSTWTNPRRGGAGAVGSPISSPVSTPLPYESVHDNPLAYEDQGGAGLGDGAQAEELHAEAVTPVAATAPTGSAPEPAESREPHEATASNQQHIGGSDSEAVESAADDGHAEPQPGPSIPDTRVGDGPDVAPVVVDGGSSARVAERGSRDDTRDELLVAVEDAMATGVIDQEWQQYSADTPEPGPRPDEAASDENRQWNWTPVVIPEDRGAVVAAKGAGSGVWDSQDLLGEKPALKLQPSPPSQPSPPLVASPPKESSPENVGYKGSFSRGRFIRKMRSKFLKY